jgi:hypothetical protein
MTKNEKRLVNVTRILILELEAAYHGLRTLPRQHSAVEAVKKAEELLDEVRSEAMSETLPH